LLLVRSQQRRMGDVPLAHRRVMVHCAREFLY
jgi:hypothetical protein